PRRGVRAEWLAADDVRRRLPLLELDDVLGGTFYGRDGLCDPSSVVAGYVTGARRLGARLITDTAVTGVGAQETAAVDTAAGQRRERLAHLRAPPLPIVPLRRQMLVTTPLPEVPSD